MRTIAGRIISHAYSCACGAIESKSHLGEICSSCHKEVLDIIRMEVVKEIRYPWSGEEATLKKKEK